LEKTRKTLEKVRGMLNIISLVSGITYKRRYAHSVIINGLHTFSCVPSTGYEPGDAPKRTIKAKPFIHSNLLQTNKRIYKSETFTTGRTKTNQAEDQILSNLA
jgi:hypothetical protein